MAIVRLMVVAFTAILASTAADPPRRAAAQAANMPGSYTLDSAASQDIAVAVDKVADETSFFIRPIVRQRLMAADPPIHGVTISLAGSNVTVTWDDGLTATTPTDGTPVDWVSPSGATGKFTAVWEGPVLKRTFSTPDGQRVNVYSLDSTGRVLTLEITVSSPQLPAVVNYKLVFRRRV